MNIENLQAKAKQIRINLLKAITNAKSGHPGGSLSIADILSVLYFEILKHDSKNPSWSERDRLVISKGHASPAVYSALGLAGYFDINDFVKNFRKLGSPYQGHIDHLKVPGVEVSTGSLGQGLSVAVGMSLSLRLDNSLSKVFCILSDGELQEGQNWEAIMSAGHYKLGNLTAIVDRNRIQLDGFTEDTMALDPLDKKFESFGWKVQEINGHNISEIKEALKNSKNRNLTDKPLVIIANTIKGKGVSFMENQVKWHGNPPSQEELDIALGELR